MTKIRTVNVDEQLIEVTLFDAEDDLKRIENGIAEVMALKRNLQELGGRAINIPEVLTEGLVCHYFNLGRCNGEGSFDCIDLNTHEKVEVKSTQLEIDLTSFSPRPLTWSYLLFVDLYNYPEVVVYKLEKESIELVQISSTQSFTDQQAQGRRPRLSIKSKVIDSDAIKPIGTFNI